MRILFILGAGASVDSGLKTYRGLNSEVDFEPEKFLTKENFQKNPKLFWETLKPFYEQIFNNSPGKTYSLINEYINKESYIITQNIDGYVNSINCESSEIHGDCKNMICIKCKEKNNINLNNPKCLCGNWCLPSFTLYEDIPNLQKACRMSKKKYDYTLVIGTSLQFGYIKQFIINSKQLGSKIVHINPDPQYFLGRNEILIKKESYEGLLEFFSTFKI